MKKYLIIPISLLILGCNKANKNAPGHEISKKYAEEMVVLFNQYLKIVDHQYVVTATFEELSKKGLSRELYDNYMKSIEETNAALRQAMEDGHKMGGPNN